MGSDSDPLLPRRNENEKHWISPAGAGAAALALVASSSVPAAAAPPTPPTGFQEGTAFDGTYVGFTALDTRNGDQTCKPGATSTLIVTKEYATMGGGDGRTGWVSSDRSLKMSGTNNNQTALAVGSFQNGMFVGQSIYPGPPKHCVYTWTIKRQ